MCYLSVKIFAMNVFKQKLFFLWKLPMAFLVGLRIRQLSKEGSVVSIRYSYLTKNPFRSMYFACQAMAAELSTGILGLKACDSHNISMLVVNMEAQYSKKAVGTIHFRCDDGQAIEDVVQRAMEMGEGQTLKVKSVGVDEAGDVVSTFYFSWSFKKRK